jgi:uncharacterized protein DUF5655
VPRWTCPSCDREFARANQSHVCVPGCTPEETFAGHNPVYPEIYAKIMAHLEALGPVHADAVKVGVFLKSTRKFAEIRPKARSLVLWLALPERMHSPRIARQERTSVDTVYHVLKLTGVSDVDDELGGWLTMAYDFATD